MQKKKTAVPTYLGVAAVWIGSHFGPGFATGAFSVRWYVKYGWVGLVTPLLAMLITGGVMYFMLEYAREHGTPNYRPFARSCYGEKLGGVVAVLYDICFLMTMMCAGGLAFSGEGKLLQGFLGVNYWATAIVTILISAALCLYGSKLLAKSSGYLITILLMVCLIFTLFSYTNVFDVCAETLPVMSVLNRLGMKWLQWLYVILMTLAVLTSAAGLAHAGNVRFDGLFRFIKNAQLRRFVITDARPNPVPAYLATRVPSAPAFSGGDILTKLNAEYAPPTVPAAPASSTGSSTPGGPTGTAADDEKEVLPF